MRCQQRLWVSVPAGSLSSEIIWHKKRKSDPLGQILSPKQQRQVLLLLLPITQPPSNPCGVSSNFSDAASSSSNVAAAAVTVPPLFRPFAWRSAKMRRKEKITGRLTPVKRVNRNSLLPPSSFVLCWFCKVIHLQCCAVPSRGRLPVSASRWQKSLLFCPPASSFQ